MVVFLKITSDTNHAVFMKLPPRHCDIISAIMVDNYVISHFKIVTSLTTNLWSSPNKRFVLVFYSIIFYSVRIDPEYPNMNTLVFVFLQEINFHRP